MLEMVHYILRCIITTKHVIYLSAARGSGEHCKLPQQGLGRSLSGHQIWCILAWKSDIWWHQFFIFPDFYHKKYFPLNTQIPWLFPVFAWPVGTAKQRLTSLCFRSRPGRARSSRPMQLRTVCSHRHQHRHAGRLASAAHGLLPHCHCCTPDSTTLCCHCTITINTYKQHSLFKKAQSTQFYWVFTWLWFFGVKPKFSKKTQAHGSWDIYGFSIIRMITAR